MRTFEPAARMYFRSTLQNKKITFCFVVFSLIRTFEPAARKYSRSEMLK